MLYYDRIYVPQGIYITKTSDQKSVLIATNGIFRSRV